MTPTSQQLPPPTPMDRSACLASGATLLTETRSIVEPRVLVRTLRRGNRHRTACHVDLDRPRDGSFCSKEADKEYGAGRDPNRDSALAMGSTLRCWTWRERNLL